MKIEIKIDETCREPKVTVSTDRVSDEVNRIIKLLSSETPEVITGFHGDEVKIIDQRDIIRIYAANSRVYAVTEDGEYTLRLRLYEVEERIDKSSFVRISVSEIINLKKAKCFDLSLAGTIRVQLSGGTSSYVSRRYVKKIKSVLGI